MADIFIAPSTVERPVAIEFSAGKSEAGRWWHVTAAIRGVVIARLPKWKSEKEALWMASEFALASDTVDGLWRNGFPRWEGDKDIAWAMYDEATTRAESDAMFMRAYQLLPPAKQSRFLKMLEDLAASEPRLN